MKDQHAKKKKMYIIGLVFVAGIGFIIGYNIKDIALDLLLGGSMF